MVNDYWQVAIEEACDFVHLGQGDLDTADLKAIRKAGMRLGVSTHDSRRAGARKTQLMPDYIALGPIYPTLLKKMPWAPAGTALVSVSGRSSSATTPLVAIGGLTVERLPPVFGAGADVAAVVTDIVRHADPDARTREWIEAAQRVH